LRLARRAGRLWRRKSSRTRAAQGARHQWQRQAGEGAAGISAGSPVSGVYGVDALVEVMAMHD
jgi:hypothetical protein